MKKCLIYYKLWCETILQCCDDTHFKLKKTVIWLIHWNMVLIKSKIQVLKKHQCKSTPFLFSPIVPSAMVTCDKHCSRAEVVIVLGYTVGSVKCCLSVLVLHSLRFPWFLVLLLLLLLLAPTRASHPSATATKHTYSQKIVNNSCDIDRKSVFTIFWQILLPDYNFHKMYVVKNNK